MMPNHFGTTLGKGARIVSNSCRYIILLCLSVIGSICVALGANAATLSPSTTSLSFGPLDVGQQSDPQIIQVVLNLEFGFLPPSVQETMPNPGIISISGDGFEIEQTNGDPATDFSAPGTYNPYFYNVTFTPEASGITLGEIIFQADINRRTFTRTTCAVPFLFGCAQYNYAATDTQVPLSLSIELAGTGNPVDNVSTIPVPGTLPLLAASLAFLGLVGGCRKRRTAAA